MSDATTEFFRSLAARGRDPLLGKTTGVLRFELTDAGRTERWLVTIGKDWVDASRKNGPADCIVHADRHLFDAIVSGEMNTFAAILRGAMRVEGDRGVLLPFQRLFPGPQVRRP